MLEFRKVDDAKVWEIYSNDDVVFKLNVITSTITNKFHIITNFVTRLSKEFGSVFDDWLLNFLNEYEANTEMRYELMQKAVPTIKEFVDSYIQECGVDFSTFVEKSKIKKNSIVMQEEEVKDIIRMSSCLKIYSLISQSSDLKLPKEQSKKIYHKFEEDISYDTMNKIYNVVKTKKAVDAKIMY